MGTPRGMQRVDLPGHTTSWLRLAARRFYGVAVAGQRLVPTIVQPFLNAVVQTLAQALAPFLSHLQGFLLDLGKRGADLFPQRRLIERDHLQDLVVSEVP